MSKPEYTKTLDSINGAHSSQVKLATLLKAVRQLADEVEQIAATLEEIRVGCPLHKQ